MTEMTSVILYRSPGTATGQGNAGRLSHIRGEGGGDFPFRRPLTEMRRRSELGLVAEAPGKSQ